MAERDTASQKKHDASQPHDPSQTQPQPQSQPKAKTADDVAKDATDKPTFTGAATPDIPDLPPNQASLAQSWLQNSLVCDQNKQDFVYLSENTGGYNGWNWQATCLKCGWQTYQPTKKDATDYLLNFHLIMHIKQGARPSIPLIGPTADTMAPSGIPFGPQPGQHQQGHRP